MAYERLQFDRDRFGVTLGGGQMNNPGRYLTLLPPINGANAFTGSPYFTENPGDKAHMYDATVTFDYMPSQWLTFRWEGGYRHSDVPYFTGRGGFTPPNGVNSFLNTGSPASYVCTNGLTSEVLTGTTTNAGPNTFSLSGGGFGVDNNGRPAGGGGAVDQACNFQNGGNAGSSSGWSAWAPDLRNGQANVTFAIMTRFYATHRGLIENRHDAIRRGQRSTHVRRLGAAACTSADVNSRGVEAAKRPQLTPVSCLRFIAIRPARFEPPMSRLMPTRTELPQRLRQSAPLRSSPEMWNCGCSRASRNSNSLEPKV